MTKMTFVLGESERFINIAICHSDDSYRPRRWPPARRRSIFETELMTAELTVLRAVQRRHRHLQSSVMPVSRPGASQWQT